MFYIRKRLKLARTTIKISCSLTTTNKCSNIFPLTLMKTINGFSSSIDAFFYYVVVLSFRILVTVVCIQKWLNGCMNISLSVGIFVCVIPLTKIFFCLFTALLVAVLVCYCFHFMQQEGWLYFISNNPYNNNNVIFIFCFFF